MAGPSVCFQWEYLFSVDGDDENRSSSIRNSEFLLMYLCIVYERYIHMCVFVCVRAYMF